MLIFIDLDGQQFSEDLPPEEAQVAAQEWKEVGASVRLKRSSAERLAATIARTKNAQLMRQHQIAVVDGAAC